MCGEPFADPLGDLRDDSVTETSKSVHPMGHPMSHSTQGGFRLPPALLGPTARPSKPFTGTIPVDTESPVSLWSLAVGVGHDVRADTASTRFPPSRLLRGVTRPPWLPSDASGVGQGFRLRSTICTSSERLTPN